MSSFIFTHFILLSASSNGSRKLQRSYKWTLTPWKRLGTRLASTWRSSFLLLPQGGLVHFGRTVLADSLQRSLLTPGLGEREHCAVKKKKNGPGRTRHPHISELHLGRCFCALSDLSPSLSEEADRNWATWLTPISISQSEKLLSRVWPLSDLC